MDLAFAVRETERRGEDGVGVVGEMIRLEERSGNSNSGSGLPIASGNHFLILFFDFTGDGVVRALDELIQLLYD